MRIDRTQAKSGRVLLPWLFILVMICSLFWLLNRVNLGRRQSLVCQSNLKAIYTALQMCELETGTLPNLAFYPEDATLDTDSMLQVLQTYGLDPDRLLCPSTPGAVREHGISYLWNPELNGSPLQDRIEPLWMVVDIQALDDELPGPHFGLYHILYTDGRIERSPLPPRSLPVEYEKSGSGR